MSTYRVFVFNEFFRGGRVGGWQKHAKIVGFLADFGGAAQTGWGRFGDLEGCLLVRLSGGRSGVSVRVNAGPEADAARLEAGASVPSTG